MIYTKKRRYKPLYKHFIKLNEDIQARKKILKFKKEKWGRLISRINWKLKWYNKYNNYKDHTKYLVCPKPNQWDSYTKGKYRLIMRVGKQFKLQYGWLSKKSVKRSIALASSHKIINYKNENLTILALFESRLDSVLYRAKFSASVREAQQMIVHGKIFVNDSLIKKKIHYLKPGDVVTVDGSLHSLVLERIHVSNLRVRLPEHLIVNYNILHIYFGLIQKDAAMLRSFNYDVNVEKLMLDYPWR